MNHIKKQCYFCKHKENRDDMYYSYYLQEFICNTCFENYEDRDKLLQLDESAIMNWSY